MGTTPSGTPWRAQPAAVFTCVSIGSSGHVGSVWRHDERTNTEFPSSQSMSWCHECSQTALCRIPAGGSLTATGSVFSRLAINLRRHGRNTRITWPKYAQYQLCWQNRRHTKAAGQRQGSWTVAKVKRPRPELCHTQERSGPRHEAIHQLDVVYGAPARQLLTLLPCPLTTHKLSPPSPSS